MDTIAEFGRVFFGALYDLRIPVAVGSVVAGVALVVIAWRQGWFAAARRHPGRSGAALVVALAIGLPLTWYLASPIFLRTQLIEPDPVGAVATPTPIASPVASQTPAASPAAATSTPGPTAKPTPTPFEPVAILSGEFYGLDDFHFGSGTATVIEVEPGRYRLRLADFSVRNGPDLYVYLSPRKDGYASGAVEIGVLKATDGSFGYDLPTGLDPTEFRSAIIWCKQFSHLFATAPFDEG